MKKPLRWGAIAPYWRAPRLVAMNTKPFAAGLFVESVLNRFESGIASAVSNSTSPKAAGFPANPWLCFF